MSPTEGRELGAAAARYAGELLPGFFEAWVLTEREHLAGSYLEALHQLVRTREELSDLTGALAAARQAVAADPLREEAHYVVMRLYAATGQPSACLRQYQELERLLREELGETPSGEARVLAEELQRNARRLVVARRPPAGGGDEETERTEAPGESATVASVEGPRLLPSSDPPHVSPSPNLPLPPAPPPSARSGPRLPLQLNRFFGREAEMAQLAELLTSPVVRLVTVTGPGGSGKTRLAIAVAGRLQEAFKDAVWFISLADLKEARLIPDTIVGALELPRSGQVDPLEQVRAALHGQRAPGAGQLRAPGRGRSPAGAAPAGAAAGPDVSGHLASAAGAGRRA